MPLGYTYRNLTCFLGRQSISQHQAPNGPHKVVSGTTYAWEHWFMFYCIPPIYSTCTHTRQMRRGTVTTCPRVCQVGRVTCEIEPCITTTWTTQKRRKSDCQTPLLVQLTPARKNPPENPLICMIKFLNLLLICRRFYVDTLIKNGAILRRHDAIQNKKLCDLEHEWCHFGHWENNVIL